MRPIHTLLAIALGAAGSAPAAQAEQAPEMIRFDADAPFERAREGAYVGEPGIDPGLLTEGFLAGHPDLASRRAGLHAYSRGEYPEALDHFRRAARYADKPSQAMLGEMYWEGLGVAPDRELGYAWMDIAAERLYPHFIMLREQYWSALDTSERRAALVRGKPLMAEFGDEAAKPRLARVMRKHLRAATGSRVGFLGALSIQTNTGPLAGKSPGALVSQEIIGAGPSIPAGAYYSDEYWDPKKYWARQDRAFFAPQSPGHVDVGAAAPVKETPEKSP